MLASTFKPNIPYRSLLPKERACMVIPEIVWLRRLLHTSWIVRRINALLSVGSDCTVMPEIVQSCRLLYNTSSWLGRVWYSWISNSSKSKLLLTTTTSPIRNTNIATTMITSIFAAAIIWLSASSLPIIPCFLEGPKNGHFSCIEWCHTLLLLSLLNHATKIKPTCHETIRFIDFRPNLTRTNRKFWTNTVFVLFNART